METNIRHRLGPPPDDLRERLNKSDLRERLSHRRRHRSSQGRETLQLVVPNTGVEEDHERRFMHVPELEEEDPTLLEIRQSLEYDFGHRRSRSRSRSRSRRRSGDAFEYDPTLSRTVPNEHHQPPNYNRDYEPRHYDDYRNERPLHEEDRYGRNDRYDGGMYHRYDERRPDDRYQERSRNDHHYGEFEQRRYSAEFDHRRSDYMDQQHQRRYEERRYSNESYDMSRQPRSNQEFRPQMQWRDENNGYRNAPPPPPSFQEYAEPRQEFRLVETSSGNLRHPEVNNVPVDSEPFMPPLPWPALSQDDLNENEQSRGRRPRRKSKRGGNRENNLSNDHGTSFSSNLRDSGVSAGPVDSEPLMPTLPLPAPSRVTKKADDELQPDLTGIVPIGSSSQTMNNAPMDVADSDDDEVMSVAPKEIAEDPFAKMTTEEIKEKLDDLKENEQSLGRRNRQRLGRRPRENNRNNDHGSSRPFMSAPVAAAAADVAARVGHHSHKPKALASNSSAFKDFMSDRDDHELAQKRESNNQKRQSKKRASSNDKKSSAFSDFMHKKDDQDLSLEREINKIKRERRNRSPKDANGRVKSRTGNQRRDPSPRRRSRGHDTRPQDSRSFSPIRSRNRQMSPQRPPRSRRSRSPSIEEVIAETEMRRRAPSPPRGLFENVRPKSLSPRRGPPLKFMGAATPGICPCCGSEFHQLPECHLFLEKSTDKRWKLVENYANVCSLCLKTGHNHNVCGNFEIKCCTQEARHHPLLHPGPVVELDISDDDPLPTLNCSLCKSTQHQVNDCPQLFCHKCKRTGHFPQNCDGQQIKQVCQYCKMPGHTISICPIVLCRRCGRQGHTDLTCTNEVVAGTTVNLGRNCFECGGVGHQSNNCPNLRCSICQGRGHWANQCQQCHNCGVAGHMKRDCPLTEFRAAPQPPRNVVTFDYHHLATSNNITNVNAEKPSMIRFFSQRLSEKGKPVSLCDEMIHTWRLSGYNQDSLLDFVGKNRPPNRTQLRLMLVKELAKVPAASLPISVNISELLDVTVDYLMPEDNVNFMEGKLASKTKDMTIPNVPQMTDQTMERLQKLASMIDLQVGCPGSDERNAFDSRLQSMEPVRLFIKDRMSKLARQFKITSEYVEKTASTIVKLLASCGFASLIMRRHLAAYGPVSLGELISTKIRLYEPHFPPGINAKFIITFVLDFLEENEL